MNKCTNAKVQHRQRGAWASEKGAKMMPKDCYIIPCSRFLQDLAEKYEVEPLNSNLELGQDFLKHPALTRRDERPGLPASPP